MLSIERLKDDLMDMPGMLMAFAVTFIAAPLAAALICLIPMNTGIIVGLFLVATMSQTRDILIHSGTPVTKVLLVVFTFHCLLLVSAWLLIRIGNRGKGRRESILFIGSQKTLPLSVILQMPPFPHDTIIPLVYVLHHIDHLMMDTYLVEYLQTR